MASDSPADELTVRTAAQFATTHWSVVLAAGDSTSPDSQDALEKLCRQYWYPLYAYVRRRGYRPEDAEDLTQGFFAIFLKKGYAEHADRSRGRFRTFLLTSMQNFIHNARDQSAAWKRGGRQQFVSWDAAVLEGRYQAESQLELSPEEIFEKRWAATLLQQVLDLLRTEFDSEARGFLFERLKDHLWSDESAPPFARVAEELGVNATNLRVAAFRLRRRFREILRHEIAHTVGDPADVDDEIRYLIRVLGR